MTKLYIVAQRNDEYSDTAHLRDVLVNDVGLAPYFKFEAFNAMAFKSLEDAKLYLGNFDGTPAFSDGSGNAKNCLSIYECTYFDGDAA